MARLRQRLRQLRSYGRKVVLHAPWLFAACVAVGLIASIFEGIGLFLLVPILEQLGLGGGGTASQAVGSKLNEAISLLGLKPSLESLLAIFLFLMLLRSCVNLLLNEATARLSSSFLSDLRVSIYRTLTDASWLYLARLRSSTFTHALTRQAEQVANGADVILRLMANVLSILAGAAVALVLSPGLTLAAAASAILIALPMTYFDFRAYRIGRKSWRLMQGIYEQLSRHFMGLKAARAMSLEAQYRHEFDTLSHDYARNSLILARNAAATSFIHGMTAALMLCTLIYLAVKTGASTVEPVLLAVVFARLLPRFQNLQYDVQELMSLLPQDEALDELMAGARASRELPGGPVQALHLAREIVLRDISFRFDESGANVIGGLSLTVPARGSLGLLGMSGAGKTTLADILSGLLFPASGSFIVDGRQLMPADLASWRQSVAYVTQEEFLFHDTVRANLIIGQRDVTETELSTAIKAANFEDVLRNLPQGLDTIVGDRGAQLSRGQRQRLCLARALLRRPSLLILDEATSALNPVDEADVITALKGLSQHLAVVVIAHRLSSVAWTDRIAVLAQGRVVESGPLASLLETPDGIVRAMAAIESLNSGRC